MFKEDDLTGLHHFRVVDKTFLHTIFTIFCVKIVVLKILNPISGLQHHERPEPRPGDLGGAAVFVPLFPGGHELRQLRAVEAAGCHDVQLRCCHFKIPSVVQVIVVMVCSCDADTLSCSGNGGHDVQLRCCHFKVPSAVQVIVVMVCSCDAAISKYLQLFR